MAMSMSAGDTDLGEKRSSLDTEEPPPRPVSAAHEEDQTSRRWLGIKQGYLIWGGALFSERSWMLGVIALFTWQTSMQLSPLGSQETTRELHRSCAPLSQR